MGPMRVLGAMSNQLHEELAAYAYDSGIDTLICVGEATKSAHNAQAKSMYFENVQQCVTALDGLITPGDVVGVKASRGPDPHCSALFPIVESLESSNADHHSDSDVKDTV